MSKRFFSTTWCAAAVGLSVLFPVSSPAQAAMVYWTNSAGGSYHTAANWSTGTVPLATDDISLPPLGKKYTVTCKKDVAVRNAYIGNSYPLPGGSATADATNGPVLNVGAYKFESSGTTLTVGTGGTMLQNGGLVSGPINVYGDFQTKGGTLYGQRINVQQGGRFTGSGTIVFNIGILNLGSVEFGPAKANVTVSPVQLINGGTWDFTGPTGSTFSSANSTNAQFVNASYGIGTPTVRKRGSTGVLQINNVSFTGSGVIDCQTGHINLNFNNAAGTANGDLGGQIKVGIGTSVKASIEANSVLRLSGSYTGEGTVSIEKGNVTTHQAVIACKQFHNRGVMRLSGLTVNAGATLNNYREIYPTGTGFFRISAGGFLNVAPASGSPYASLSAIPDVAGTFIWKGASSVGGANILPGGSMKISGDGSHRLSGPITNRGTLEWTGGDITRDSSDAALSNLEGGLIDIRNGSTVNYKSSGVSWSNDKTSKIWVRLPPGRTSSLTSGKFSNAGLVEVTSGIFSLAGVGEFGANTFYSDPFGNASTARYYVRGTLQLPGNISPLSVDLTLDSPSATITNSSGVNVLPNFGSVAKWGQLRITGGKNLAVTGDFSNTGIVRVDAGSTLSLTGVQKVFRHTAWSSSSGVGMTILNGGTLSTTGSGSVDVPAGTLMGAGLVSSTLKAGGDVYNGFPATMEPGFATGSPLPGVPTGRISVARGFTQGYSHLKTDIGGTDATASQYDQLRVTGKVTLGQGSLLPQFVNGFESRFGDTFVLIENDGTDAVIGIFLGTVEGRLFNIGNRTLRLSYKGGDGNDVTLRDVVQASIAPTTVTETNTGSKAAAFTVTLTPAPTDPVTIQYRTLDGTANGSDYTATTGTVSFAAGESSKTITVPVSGDVLDEDDETFSLELYDPVNVELANTSATCTILDNDASPTVSIRGASVRETDSGTVPMSFVISLSTVSGRPVTVLFSTGETTPVGAIAGVDYESISGKLVTFAPGETTQTVEVTVPCDRAYEGNRAFLGLLTDPVGATLNVASATGTITENDPQPTLSIADLSFTEGTGENPKAIFSVTLNGSAGRPVTVDYATTGGTATSGIDFLEATGQLTFAGGETTKTIEVEIVADNLAEPTETFTVKLSQPQVARLSRATATASILNDDATATTRKSGQRF